MKAERTRNIYGTGWEVYDMYVKHTEIRANNRAEDTIFELGLGLQLNQHWKMSSYESKIAPRGRWGKTDGGQAMGL